MWPSTSSRHATGVALSKELSAIELTAYIESIPGSHKGIRYNQETRVAMRVIVMKINIAARYEQLCHFCSLTRIVVSRSRRVNFGGMAVNKSESRVR